MVNLKINHKLSLQNCDIKYNVSSSYKSFGDSIWRKELSTLFYTLESMIASEYVPLNDNFYAAKKLHARDSLTR